MMDVAQIKALYPLHHAIFIADFEELQLQVDDGDVNGRDSNGLTPLQLCSLLGSTQAAEILLEAGADPDLESEEGWSIVQECVASGNLELAQKVLDKRERQRADKRAALINDLLMKLSNAPDFYVEMKWDFTSWVPLVARMCPSDTYKIYKSGPAVRIDSTLTGFDQASWKRGNVTFLFLANESGCEIHDINHDNQTITVERIDITKPGDSFDTQSLTSRLSSPLTSTRIKTDNVEFWREKSGVIGFRSDKTEDISGYECAVFSTSGIEIVTRERVEHLTSEQRAIIASNTSMFESLLSGSVVSQPPARPSRGSTPANVNGAALPYVVDETEEEDVFAKETSMLEYFNHANCDAVRVRAKEQTDKVQKFKARVWLSNNHPLSLQEQLLPIVELMSTGNAHFSKLKDFITLQLPAGFPVNIEIPLYHMINARITFSNINSASSPVDGVMSLSTGANGAVMSGVEENREASSCVVDAHIFTAPPEYYRIAGGNERLRQHREQQYLSDDQMLQYAIQQSILSERGGGGDVGGEGGVLPGEEELTWIEALAAVGDQEPSPRVQARQQPVAHAEDDYQRALRMSIEDEERRQTALRAQEDDELARILALSLDDK